MSYFANLCNKLRLKLFYVFAGLSSVLVMFLFLLLPMYLFRQYYDIPLSTKGHDGEIWFLIIGGINGVRVFDFSLRSEINTLLTPVDCAANEQFGIDNDLGLF